MKQTFTFRDGTGVSTVTIDMDIDTTHKQVREKIESIFEARAEAVKNRAIAKAPNAVFKIKGQEIRLKDTIDTVRIKRKGKNITNKTDAFGVIAGKGLYPGTPRNHPASVLAKPAHIELGTVKNAPRPYIWPAFNDTKGEIMSDLDGCI